MQPGRRSGHPVVVLFKMHDLCEHLFYHCEFDEVSSSIVFHASPSQTVSTNELFLILVGLGYCQVPPSCAVCKPKCYDFDEYLTMHRQHAIASASAIMQEKCACIHTHSLSHLTQVV